MFVHATVLKQSAKQLKNFSKILNYATHAGAKCIGAFYTLWCRRSPHFYFRTTPCWRLINRNFREALHVWNWLFCKLLIRPIINCSPVFSQNNIWKLFRRTFYQQQDELIEDFVALLNERASIAAQHLIVFEQLRRKAILYAQISLAANVVGYSMCTLTGYTNSYPRGSKRMTVPRGFHFRVYTWLNWRTDLSNPRPIIMSKV